MYLIALFSCSQALSLLNGKYLLLPLNIRENRILFIIRRNGQNFPKDFRKRQFPKNTFHRETHFSAIAVLVAVPVSYVLISPFVCITMPNSQN